jgi:nitrogen fixation protein FixH
MRATAPADGGQGRGRWIPWLFVGGFVLVLAVNGVMIWIAAESFTGLETEDAYRKGIHYNRNLEAAAAQAALGWRPALGISAEEGPVAVARLELGSLAGAPIEGAVVRLRFERPTQHGHDFELELEPTGGGVYRAEFAVPLAGVWNVHMVIERGADRYVSDQRVVLR